jgi:M6 family metalloprotease-like protein
MKEEIMADLPERFSKGTYGKQARTKKIRLGIGLGLVAVLLIGTPAMSAPEIQEPQSSASSLQSSQVGLFTPVGNPLSSKTSDPVGECKIQEASQNRVLYGKNNMTQSGFPISRMTPNSGVVKWALIPIEFQDLRGEKKFKLRVKKQMELLSDWYKTVSGGKLTVEWVVLGKWATLPGKESEYSIPRSVNRADSENGTKLFRQAMDAADPIFDFTGVSTVNFILPKGQTVVEETSQGFPWDQAVRQYKSNEGSIASFTLVGQVFDFPGKEYWSYWAHEFGHAIALPHVGASRGSLPPFNPWDLMGGQDGPSRELSGWLRFMAGWLSNNQIYCKNASQINRQVLTFVPLSSSRKGVKLAVVPLSKTKALLIESRRETKFSCRTTPSRDGVLVYVYDAALGHGDNFLIAAGPKRRAPQQDSCSALSNRGVPNPDFLLRKGDKVEVEGMTVEVLQHGRNDKVRISRG